MKNEKTIYQTKIIIAFAAIYIIWGSTFYGVMIALKSFPPFFNVYPPSVFSLKTSIKSIYLRNFRL